MQENDKKPKELTREYFIEQGRKGGLKTKELYGINHFKKLSKKAKKKKDELST